MAQCKSFGMNSRYRGKTTDLYGSSLNCMGVPIFVAPEKLIEQQEHL